MYTEKPGNKNSWFFDGFYKEIWRQIFPEKTTVAEVDFIMSAGALKPGCLVLDLMCGYGRHSLELGQRGVQVTAVDNLEDYMSELDARARSANLPVQAVCTDVLKLDLKKEYDAVICMGNSLQFFDAEELKAILENISAHLKTGGKFFINSWSLAEIVGQKNKEKTWNRFGGYYLLTENRFFQDPDRIETNSIIIAENGDREEKQAVDYIYSIPSLQSMFGKAGLLLKEVYSIPGQKLFSPGDPRAYIVAEKI
jgi:SAM-dependent methyltransferase